MNKVAMSSHSRLHSGALRLSWLVTLLLVASCDSTEEVTGPYDCSAGPIPADAQCLEFQGEQQAFRFVGTSLPGKWNSTDFETCIDYGVDGTAVFRHWGIVGGVPREDTHVRWGIWIDVEGDPILSGTGQPVAVHQFQSGAAIDRRLVGIDFSDASGLGGDFDRVDACPANSESEQGVITFFTTNTGTDEITVALNSFVVGELSVVTTGEEPDCGIATSQRVLTVYRQPGTYRFQALSSVATWGPTLIEVKKGACSSNVLR